MSALLALLAAQAANPYLALGAAIPEQDMDSLCAYLGQATRGGPFEGEEPMRPPAFAAANAMPLQAQRGAVDRWASILAGLRQASEAPYGTAPVGEKGFAKVKNLEKLAAMAAHVRFAQGDRHGGVTLLLDGLTMARRIRAESTLAALVGVACESIAMGGFEEHLDQIPLPECERVRTFADALLTAPNAYPPNLTEGVRAALADAPARWVVKGADPIVQAFAKDLTQMRLLRLHMRIEAYRWRYLKLPERLIDAAPQVETEDPIAQESYRYEPVATTYRLTSTGFASMGPMGLRYQRDPSSLERGGSSAGNKP